MAREKDPDPPDPTVPLETRRGRERWEKKAGEDFERKSARKADFTTVSGAQVNPLAGPDSLAGFDPDRDLAWPGEFPYTRGVHPTGYRGKIWTMRATSSRSEARISTGRI